MKTLIQKLPVDTGSSFVARTYSTPHFETPWHQHTEFELMLVREGSGTVFMGNYIGVFARGEVYLLGKNLPHWFRRSDAVPVGSAMVIHFKEDFPGEAFFELPEMAHLRKTLALSMKGLRLRGVLLEKIKDRLLGIETQPPFFQWIELLLCLHEISTSEEYELLNEAAILSYSAHDQSLINLIFEYSMLHFQRRIQLAEVAALTHQSPSVFCHFFKRSTKKSYIQFLTEIRIAHACKLLANTRKTVTEICYESGFQNWANFSRHFKKNCGMSPLAYRKKMPQ